MNKFTVIYV